MKVQAIHLTPGPCPPARTAITTMHVDLSLASKCEATLSREEWLDAPTIARRNIEAPLPGRCYARHEGEWYDTTAFMVGANLWAPSNSVDRLLPHEAEAAERVLAYWLAQDTRMDGPEMMRAVGTGQ